jgi:Arc/MetJ family transcription regulator
MRTNIVLDPTLIARAMKKAGATTMRETIDIALREYVSKPAVRVAEATATYRSGKPVRRRPTRR